MVWELFQWTNGEADGKLKQNGVEAMKAWLVTQVPRFPGDHEDLPIFHSYYFFSLVVNQYIFRSYKK